jgi:hypothetical protein
MSDLSVSRRPADGILLSRKNRHKAGCNNKEIEMACSHKQQYALQGTAFGVDIWRDPVTGDLLASRGASGFLPLDWLAFSEHHHGDPEVEAAWAAEEAAQES